ncbi:MAG: hypothetical protein ACK4K9_09045 [Bacteroidia bacterium]
MKKLTNLILATVFVINAYAQKTIKQTYTYDLPGNWENWELAAGGILLVGTSEGFSAIEAHSNKINYTYTELGKIKPEEMEVIDDFPWVMLHEGGKFNIKGKKVLFDYINGKPVFETHKHGWVGPRGYNIDFEKGLIYIYGSHSKANWGAIGIYNIETGKEIAFVDLNNKKEFGGGVFNLDMLKFIDDKAIIFQTLKGNTICVDKNTLKKLWVTDKIKINIAFLQYTFDAKNNYIYFYQNALKSPLYKVNINTGNFEWKKPIQVKGAIKQAKLLKDGLFVYSEDLKTFEVNIYDTQTGLKKWKKSFTDKGGISNKIFLDDRLVFGTTTGEVNTLYWNGTKGLKKPIETGPGFREFDLTEDGNLFYLTSRFMGIANLKDGGFVKSPAKFRKVELMTTAYDEKNQRFVVSTGNEVFFIDKEGNNKKVADIKFKEDENPNKIEFRKGGILLSASQNAMLIDYDGNVKYNVYYKAPGKSVAGKILAGAIAVTAGAAAMSNSMKAGMMQGSSPFYKSDAQKRAESNAQNFSGIAGNAVAIMKQKFKATAATKDYLYILTSLEDGIGLAKINKDTGEKEGEIIVKDKKPEYKVDDDFGVFYYKKSDKQIAGFDLR